ncbi:MAG TPA: hypothetical protein DCS59_01555 [Eubacterium sp.]|nr:hypothetical protein [Eubacterium sp.]
MFASCRKGRYNISRKGGLTLKVVAKPVNMIAVFNVNDRPCPFRFRFLDEHHRTVEVTVEHVFSVEERKTAGTDAFRYECQSRIRGQERRYVLKYLLKDARWELYKI